MGRSASIILLALALGACGRLGYGPVEDGGGVPSDSDTPDTAFPTDAALDATLDAGDDAAVMVDGGTGLVVIDDVGIALPRQDTVIALPSTLPSPLTSAAAHAVGDTVYVAGGSRDALSTSNCTRDIVVYGAGGAMSSLPGALSVANQGLGLVSVGGALYSVMGYCGGTPLEEQTVYRQDPTGVMPPVSVGTFADGAYHAATGVINDGGGTPQIVIAGGVGSGPLRDFVQRMDPTTGAVNVFAATLPSHRCMAAGATMNNSFYVFGGSTDAGCEPPPTSTTLAMTDEIVRISAAPDTIEVVATLPFPRAAACAVDLADGTIGIFGGYRYVGTPGSYTRETTDEVLIFDPTTDDVSVHAARLPVARAQMSCTRTSDGRVLLLGGAWAGDVFDEVLLFAPFATTGESFKRLDSGTPGAAWTSFAVDEMVPAGTTLAYAARAVDDPGSPDDFVAVSPGALPDTLPAGRYLEIRATMSTTDPALTPQVQRLEATFAR